MEKCAFVLMVGLHHQKAYSFIAITVHWIDDEWKLQQTLLDFVHQPFSHSGKNIAELLYEVLSEFNLLSK
jgi:hypothetical protein